MKVRQEVSKRTAQSPRSNAHRVDSFRIGPIERRFLKTIQLFKPRDEYELYSDRRDRVAIDSFDSFSFRHRLLLCLCDFILAFISPRDSARVLQAPDRLDQ